MEHGTLRGVPKSEGSAAPGGLISLYSRIKRFNVLCATLSGLLLLFVNFSITVDVILRYFFSRPSIWITEVSTYLFLYIIFLATSYALQGGMHIRVTFLMEPFGPKAKQGITLVTSIFSMAFVFVLLWQTSILTWTAFTEKWLSPTILSAPVAYVYVAMVFGALMLLVTFLFRTYFEFKAGVQGD